VEGTNDGEWHIEGIGGFPSLLRKEEKFVYIPDKQGKGYLSHLVSKNHK
jgi:hypothetical protein